MIYFTGDTHGHLDTGKLSGRAFPLQKRLRRKLTQESLLPSAESPLQ